MKVSKEGGYRAFIAALVVANVGAGSLIATNAFAGEGEGAFGCGPKGCWCIPTTKICSSLGPEEPNICQYQSDCRVPPE